jgi:NAD(P)H-hydrate epimerase
MVTIDPDEDCFSALLTLRHSRQLVSVRVSDLMKNEAGIELLIQNAAVPLLFDADALTILGENKTWISFVPKNSVFTPHPKEFERLVGKASDDFQRNRLQRSSALSMGFTLS